MRARSSQLYSKVLTTVAASLTGCPDGHKLDDDSVQGFNSAERCALGQVGIQRLISWIDQIDHAVTS